MKKTISLILCVALFSGCAGKKPIAFYPEFPNKKQEVKNIAVMADVVLMRDVMGSADKIDFSENKATGELLLKALREALEENDYSVKNMLLASSGLLFEGNKTSFKVQAPNSKEFALKNPPFYIDDSLQNNQEKLTVYKSALLSVARGKAKEGQSNTKIQNARKLTDDSEVNGIAFVMLTSRHVPGWKSFSQGVALGLVTVFTFGIGIMSWSQSMTRVQFGILDLKTEEIVWTDSLDWESYYCNSDGKVKSVVNRIIDHLT